MARQRKNQSEIKPIDMKSFKRWARDESIPVKSFAIVTDSLFKNPTFQTLTPNEKLVYIALQMKCKGNSSYTFPQTTYEELGFAKSTVIDAIKKLVKKGFIIKRRAYGGKPTQYTFIDSWKIKE